MKTFIALIAVSILCLSSQAAKGNIKVEMTNIKGAAYVSPSGTDILVIRSPVRFRVRITNTSGSAQRIWVDKKNGGLKSVSFEVTDATGKRVIIKKKQKFAAKTMWVMQVLKPSQSVAVGVLMNEEEWENYSAAEPGKERRLKVRAVVVNQSKKYISDTYNVVINVPRPPAAFSEADPKDTPKEVPPIFVVE